MGIVPRLKSIKGGHIPTFYSTPHHHHLHNNNTNNQLQTKLSTAIMQFSTVLTTLFLAGSAMACANGPYKTGSSCGGNCANVKRCGDGNHIVSSDSDAIHLLQVFVKFYRCARRFGRGARICRGVACDLHGLSVLVLMSLIILQ